MNENIFALSDFGYLFDTYGVIASRLSKVSLALVSETQSATITAHDDGLFSLDEGTPTSHMRIIELISLSFTINLAELMADFALLFTEERPALVSSYYGNLHLRNAAVLARQAS